MGIYPARFRGAEKLGSALCRQKNVQAVILMALLLFISRNNAWCLRDESLFSEYHLLDRGPNASTKMEVHSNVFISR